MLNVVLLEPEIPSNTGTIGRSCVLTGTRLHLIEPLSFSLEDRMIRRAGMGYWHDIDLVIHPSWDAFLTAAGPNARLWFFTKRAAFLYHKVEYADGDYLIFGKESAGIEEAILAKYPEQTLRIPQLERAHVSPKTTRGPLSDPTDPDARSLNQSNAVNIVLFEALRQLGFPGIL